MLKKNLLFGAIALGLSGAAFGMGDKSLVDTFNPAFYLGLQAGYGLTNAGDISGLDDYEREWSVGHDNGAVGRIFIGYDFHKYFAAELGYMRFLQKTKLYADGVLANQVVVQTMDLLGKAKFPINDFFGIYAKAGLGYTMNSFDSRDTAVYGNNNKYVGIVYGVGINYNITSNIMADLSWMRYGSGHHSINADGFQPDYDLFMLGISYKFNF